MKKVNYGKIHDYAQCENCSWDYTSIHGHERTNILYHIRKHIKQTNHVINRETGTSCTYSPN